MDDAEMDRANNAYDAMFESLEELVRDAGTCQSDAAVCLMCKIVSMAVSSNITNENFIDFLNYSYDVFKAVKAKRSNMNDS